MPSRFDTGSAPGPERRAEQVEGFADEIASWPDLGEIGLRALLLNSLLDGLAGESAHDDADAEDALCSALTRLGVMERIGNRNFRLVPMRQLAPSDLAIVQRYRGWLPSRYWEGD